MWTIILDFTGCKYRKEIYCVIKQSFDFPDYYGENLDALWDYLDFYSRRKLNVEIKGLHSLPYELNVDMEEIMGEFNAVHKEKPNITFEIIS